jgi:hypothetical protein
MFRKVGVCSVAVITALMGSSGCETKGAGDAAFPGYGDAGSESAEHVLTLPAGTTFVVAMDTSLSTDESETGDPFLAHVAEPVHSGGDLVVPAGAEVHGRVSDVQDGEQTSMTLQFTEIQVAGDTHPLDVQPIELIAEPEGPSDAAIVLGTGAAGAVIGAAIDGGKGAAIGGVGGITAGTVAVMIRGSEVQIPVGQQVALRLESPAEVRTRG